MCMSTREFLRRFEPFSSQVLALDHAGTLIGSMVDCDVAVMDHDFWNSSKQPGFLSAGLLICGMQFIVLELQVGRILCVSRGMERSAILYKTSFGTLIALLNDCRHRAKWAQLVKNVDNLAVTAT
eukprot:ANDGO_07633.mRNA.1 hypothetical protein